jgi:hypothetical protein
MEKKEKKMMKKGFSNRKGGAEILLLGCLFFILLIVGGGVVAAGYFGLIPGLSKIMGTNKPRDLGIRYANIDRIKFFDSLGTKVTTTNQVTGTGLDTGLLLEGKKTAKYSFSSEEATAVANSQWKYFPFSDVQIKIGQDGTIEASALFKADKIVSFAKSLNFSEEDIAKAAKDLKIPVMNTPIYAKGKFSVEEGKVQINPQNIEIGKIPVPSSIVEKLIPQITEAVNSLINSFPGFYIKSLSFNEGKMNFEGTVPAKMTVLTE